MHEIVRGFVETKFENALVHEPSNMNNEDLAEQAHKYDAALPRVIVRQIEKNGE